MTERGSGPDDGNRAEIKFERAIVDEGGKRTRTVTMQNGSANRFESAIVGFRNNDLLIEAKSSGFDVNIKNLNVFAGKKQLLRGGLT